VSHTRSGALAGVCVLLRQAVPVAGPAACTPRAAPADGLAALAAAVDGATQSEAAAAAARSASLRFALEQARELGAAVDACAAAAGMERRLLAAGDCAASLPPQPAAAPAPLSPLRESDDAPAAATGSPIDCAARLTAALGAAEEAAARRAVARRALAGDMLAEAARLRCALADVAAAAGAAEH
jgi:hypothetical protein